MGQYGPGWRSALEKNGRTAADRVATPWTGNDPDDVGAGSQSSESSGTRPPATGERAGTATAAVFDHRPAHEVDCFHAVATANGPAHHGRLGGPAAAAARCRHRRSDRHGRRAQAVPGAGRSRTRCSNTTSRCSRSNRPSRTTTSTPAAASRSRGRGAADPHPRPARSGAGRRCCGRPDEGAGEDAPQRTVLLEQVARIVEGPQLKRGDASVNGQPGVVLTIVKQPHIDTRDLTDQHQGGPARRPRPRCRPTSSSTPSCSSSRTSSTAASTTSARRW